MRSALITNFSVHNTVLLTPGTVVEQVSRTDVSCITVTVRNTVFVFREGIFFKLKVIFIPRLFPSYFF